MNETCGGSTKKENGSFSSEEVAESDIPDWELPFFIGDELRELGVRELVHIYHLTHWSMILFLPGENMPRGVRPLFIYPQWRVSTLTDWRKVLPQILERLNSLNLSDYIQNAPKDRECFL